MKQTLIRLEKVFEYAKREISCKVGRTAIYENCCLPTGHLAAMFLRKDLNINYG